VGILLKIATSDHQKERVEGLIDGTVSLSGCQASFINLIPGENVLLKRAFEDSEFNVSELSLSKYVALRAEGICPYTAIPVFIARSFRHGDIFVRAGGGISTPGDLRGSRVGTGDYIHTAHVWVRVLLQREYGVRPEEIRWVVGHRERICDGSEHFTEPHGVTMERAAGKSLSTMLQDGDIDALISPIPPSCFGVDPKIVRLFEDPLLEAERSFQGFPVFPILHTMALRNELAERHPHLPAMLTDAFTACKERWVQRMRHGGGSLEAQREFACLQRLMPNDPYPYGLGPDQRHAISIFLETHFEQGLSARRMYPEEIFHTD